MGVQTEEEDEQTRWEREAEESGIAEETRELEDAWKAQVKSVLSNSRIDPKCAGQKFEWLEKYDGDVTPEQITALKRSSYGRSYQAFVKLWKKLPEEGRGDLWGASDMFARISALGIWRLTLRPW